jgi:hypothetical protein
MTTEQLIKDYQEMLTADRKHLAEAMAAGNRTEAHGFVDSIIDLQRALEDLGEK